MTGPGASLLRLEPLLACANGMENAGPGFVVVFVLVALMVGAVWYLLREFANPEKGP